VTFVSGVAAPNGHGAILGSNFWPEAAGSSQTVTEFAEYLARRGHELRVATSMPYFPSGRSGESKAY